MDRKYSIIVPVYNAERTIRRCVDSILSQTFCDFELILVDDGSSDNSPAILDTYADHDPRIIVIHKPNGGVSSARNVGLDATHGDWIAFCDSDDFVDDTWLEDFSNATDGNDIVFQGIRYIRNGKARDKFAASSSGITREELRSYIAKLIGDGMYGYQVNKLFKKSIIDLNAIRFDEQSRFREDEQFLSEYLTHVKSWQSIANVDYNYFLPDDGKDYKGDADYSLTRIFYFLDIIFERKYCTSIADAHVANIKNMIINKVCRGEIPTDYDIDLYNRLLASSSKASSALISALINNSHNSLAARKTLQLIHRLTTTYRAKDKIQHNSFVTRIYRKFKSLICKQLPPTKTRTLKYPSLLSTSTIETAWSRRLRA